MDASKIARRHANVDIPTIATANTKYVYHYASKGEDGNVASIRRKEADQAVDEVCRPAAHGSPPIPRSTRARRPHPPYARQVEEHLNSRVYDWDRTAWSLFPPWRQQYSIHPHGAPRLHTVCLIGCRGSIWKPEMLANGASKPEINR